MMYLMRYWCKNASESKSETTETRFLAENDEEAIAFSEEYLRQKRVAFPEDQYECLELLSVKKII